MFLFFLLERSLSNIFSSRCENILFYCVETQCKHDIEDCEGEWEEERNAFDFMENL